MKTLTIIIPTYNVEKYIGNCLSSLPLNREDLEVLVIIDGSIDQSADIAKHFERLNPKVVKVIEKENGHYGSCVNVGLSFAKGRYVKILDADDSFSSNSDDYINFLHDTFADVVLTDSESVDENGDSIFKLPLGLPTGQVLSLSDLLSLGLTHLDHFNITYKTDLLRSLNYRQTEGLAYTDIEWDTIPLSIVQTISYLPIILYRYLRGRVGQSVGTTYRCNNQWMENKIILGLASYYELNKGRMNKYNAQMVRSSIHVFAARVYVHYLINYPGNLPISDLVAFDRDLLISSPEIYQGLLSDTYKRKFGTFYYIKDFRKRSSRKDWHFLYLDLCEGFRKALNTIHR